MAGFLCPAGRLRDMKWILRGLLALVLGLAILVALALQTAPAVPLRHPPTTADGAALRDLVQRLDPRRMVHLRPALLAATESELNLLLSLAAQQRPAPACAWMCRTPACCCAPACRSAASGSTCRQSCTRSKAGPACTAFA